MSSIIRLDILTLPLANEYVEFQNAITPNMRETFVGLRTQFGQSTIGSNGTAEDKLNFTLGALTGALVADYNAASSFTILLNTNVPAGDLPFITIESNIYNYFTQAKWVDSGSNFTATFTNVPTVQPITIDSFVFVEVNPGVPCEQVNAVVTTSEQVDGYSFSPTGTFLPVTTNPFTVPTLNRATSYFLYVQKGCSGGSTAPTILTNSLSNATSTTVTSGGNSLTDGGDSITARGVELSLVSDFSTIAQTKLDGTGGTNAFSVDFTGLTPNQIYYTRAFATNSVGTGYGSVVQSNPVEFQITDAYLASESQACAVSSWDGTCYMVNNTFDLDDIVYINQGLTIVYPGQSTSNPATTVFYSVNKDGVKLSLQIDSNGQIIDYPVLCP